jgi:DnaJ-domain-containing protein 1
LEPLPDVRSPRKDRPNARFHGRVGDAGHVCEHPGCDQPGEFRAPPLEGASSGDRPGRYRWFCLDHVRAFNAGYNFFEGMTAEEIHDAQRPFAGWERETRAFAANGGADRPPRWADFTDPLDAIGARFKERVEQSRRDGKPLSEGERRALKVLGLGADADRAAVRKRYAELLRRYHPDRNGGDRSHERVLQAVIEAYQRLRKAGPPRHEE